MTRNRIALGVGLAILAGGLACAPQVARRDLLRPPDLVPWMQTTLDAKPPVLKAHHRDGSLHVLEHWQIDEQRRLVSGMGVLLDARRDTLPGSFFELPIDSVALFESNVLTRSPAVGPLTVMSVLSAGVTAFCLANPKVCFGSCPTFYTDEDDGPVLQAEGFSASVAPALERTDLDALYRHRQRGDRLTLRVTNEALETHVIRHADLLAARRLPGARVFATTDGGFVQADRLLPPVACRAPEGDITDLLTAFDGLDRDSPPDSTDLATREEIDLEFAAAPDGPLGLVVASRQTLLTTYLFYHALGALGDEAAALLTRVQPQSYFADDARTAGALLGRIEVLAPDAEGIWRVVGAAGETGPLATNVHLVRLPAGVGRDGRLRLRLSRGHWRLDWLALARVAGEATVERCRPIAVRREGVRDDAALADLLDSTRTLVTLPGDRLEIDYRLPAPGADQEVFLESRGYYLEWLRTEWQADEDPAMAALMLARPDLALRQLAPSYAAAAAQLEREFWRSRYAR